MDQEEAPSRDQRTRGDSENTSSVGQPSTDGEVAPAALDRSFLDAVFGDAEGYAHFAVGRGAYAKGCKYSHNWLPLVFRWPQQADEAMRTINAALSEPGLNDVYVCPNILKTDKRDKDTAVTHRLLHSDADIGLDSSKVAALMGFAVGSGSPGHAHVYVPLAREVTSSQYEALQRGMRDYFGGDNKIADNDVLRAVGSVNYKAVVLDGQDQPYRVEWIIKRSGARMEPEAVAAVLGVALPPPDTAVAQSESRTASAGSGTAGSGSRDEEFVDLALYPDVRGAVGRVSGDRSADTHRIVSACFREGLRLAQTRWAINRRADLLGRLDGRADDDVARIFLKLADEQQDEKARARTQSGDDTGEQGRAPAPKRANRHLQDRLLSLTDLRTLPPVQPLIDGLLYRDTLGQLSGPPGCYKTFVAIAMSCALAAGESFGAFVVPKPGKVVYVAAEGVSGLETRILAWCEVWEVDPAVLQDRLFVLPLPIQLGNQVEVSEAVAVVAEVQADLLVLDTRARCTLGLEENSATAQGAAIDAADRIRTTAGCTVLGVHHSSRTGSAGRGSNAWDGAVWSDLRMDGGGLQAAIHCEKHKEVAAGCDHHFSLVRHTVSKGLMPHRFEPDRRTLVLSRTGPGLDSLSANSHRVVLDIIRTSAPDEGFTGPQIVEMAQAANVKKSTMYQALKWLVSEEYVKNIGTQRRSRYVLGDRQL